MLFRSAAEFEPSDPNHRARLQKLQQTGTQPRSTLVDLDLGGSPQSPDRDKAADTDLSKSLDQIFIR